MTANLWDRPLDRLPAYLFVHQVWIYLCARVPFWFIQVGPKHLHSPLLPTTDLPPSDGDDCPIFTLAVGCFDLFVFVLGDYGCIGIFFFLFVGGSFGLLIRLWAATASPPSPSSSSSSSSVELASGIGSGGP